MQNKKIDFNKKEFSKKVFSILIKNPNIFSATIVGSFQNKKKFNIKSDIDLVVIFKKLNKKIYFDCIKNIEKININKYTNFKSSININHSFGPIKFYNKNKITIHLMMYDLNEHYKHVMDSPFTCYDWERSNFFIGTRLKNIFPIKNLYYKDFLQSRRGVKNLISNLESNYIQIQKKLFKNGKTYHYNYRKKLTKVDKFELSYSLINNSIINFYKFKYQKNQLPTKNEFKKLFLEITHSSKLYFQFIELKKIKVSQIFFIKDYILLTKQFLGFFEKYLDQLNYSNIIYMRHAKTKCNKSIFLGQNLDLDIQEKPKKLNVNFDFQLFYSSNLKRSIQTCLFYSKRNKVIINKLLTEINYGNAEGMDFIQLKNKYNKILSKWSKKIDARFPNGENNNDVLKRVLNFNNILRNKLKKNKKNNTLIVTHNVFLRCLIGSTLNLSNHDWYKINIKYNEIINFIYYNDRIIPNFNRKKYYVNEIRNFY